MNLDNNDIELEEALYRYFGDELDDDQKEEIHAWRLKNSENQAKFDDARIAYLDLKGLAYYKKMGDADASWDEFQKENNVKAIGSFHASSFLKYAASLIIIASAVFGIYFVQNQTSQIAVTATEIQQLTLPDNSMITLNKKAVIAYKEPFQNNERRVSLTGDAYFDVVENAEAPFVVEVGETEIRVLGTKFFVNQSNSETLNVKVEEGKVLVSSGKVHEIISTSQSLKLDLNAQQASIGNEQYGLDTFWKNRKLVFDLTPIEEVVAAVSTAYGATLKLEGNMEGCALTVTFDNESIDNIVDVISSTLNYSVEKEQETYTLRGNGCQ